jgi:hypothetical protein
MHLLVVNMEIDANVKMCMVVPRVSTAVMIKAGQYGKDILQDGMLCLPMRS